MSSLVRRAAVFATVAFLIGSSVANADVVHLDGDTATPAPNVFIDNTGSTGHHACDARPTTATGQVKLVFNGDDHFNAGELLDIAITTGDPGISTTVSSPPTNMPNPWDNNYNSQNPFTYNISTTVSASLGNGTYAVTVDTVGHDSEYAAGWGDGSGKPKFNVIIDCPAIVPEVPSPAVTTEVRNGADDSTNGPPTAFDVYTQVYDHASVSGTVAIPSGSTFTFELWNGNGCGAGTEIGSPEESSTFGGASPQAADSSDSTNMHAGDYSYKVYFHSGDDSLLLDGSADCEDFTIDQSTPDVATDIHDPDHNIVTEVPLGTSVHDKAVVTGIEQSGFEPTGSVGFTFYGQNSAGATNTGDCEDTYTTGLGSIGLDGADPGTAHPSDNSGDLHAGNYAIDATYPGNNDYTTATSPCEPLVVDKADTTTTTQTLDHSNHPVTFFPGGGLVHDSATVDTSGYDGFSLNGGATVRFKLYNNGTCNGTVIDDHSVSISGSPAQTVSSPEYNLAGPGLYSYKAFYSGGADYNGSSSSCELITVKPTFLRGACSFDLDSVLTGQQFRLILTPDTTYRLTASNPGEFFYNTVTSGTPGDPFSVTIHLPYPWTTKPDNGTGNTNHVYDAESIYFNGSYWCAAPSGSELGHSNNAVTLASYGSTPTLSSTANLTVSGHFDSTGMAFVRVHLDFGLKSTLGWSNLAGSASNGAVALANNQLYTFTDTAGGGASPHSLNVFKKDPGIAGIVTNKLTGDPIVGTTVRVYSGTNTLLATLTTDSDGWYMYTYKFSGKTVTFTIKVPSYNLSQTVTTKSNTFLIVNFQV